MTVKRVMFSPVTRLSGLLSVNVTVENNKVIEADAMGTMFRGFEWIMRDRHVTDAVYLTQRVCGICSLAHGAVASYLLDELYDNELTENAQYLRNVMFGADFLQNHIRHFYLFSLPDFVKMPDVPPFQGQNLSDARLDYKTGKQMVDHYFEAIKAAQKSHQILALFGGKAPHQHSFVHGGVAVAPTADKINMALSLIGDINEFINRCFIPDTEIISRAYNDYFYLGVTPKRLLSFGLFRFGAKNEYFLWRPGVLADGMLSFPNLDLICEDLTHAYFTPKGIEPFEGPAMEPAPQKPSAYTWIKSVLYAGKHFEVGPLARMIINGWYNGGMSTMDRILARSLEARLIAGLMREWLCKIKPGQPPIMQKDRIVKAKVTAVTDAMRGALLHRAYVKEGLIDRYDIITPTMWNFSPKNSSGLRGPVESALVGTEIKQPGSLDTVLGRIIRSFDPCISCATHVLDAKGNNVYSKEL